MKVIHLFMVIFFSFSALATIYVQAVEIGTYNVIELSQATDSAAWFAFQSSLNYSEILPNQQVLNSNNLPGNNLNWFSVSVGGPTNSFSLYKTILFLSSRGQVFMLVQYEDI